MCAVHFRHNTKGGGCLAEEGEVPYMKGNSMNSARFTIDY